MVGYHLRKDCSFEGFVMGKSTIHGRRVLLMGLIFPTIAAAQKTDQPSEPPEFIKVGIESLKNEIQAIIKDPQSGTTVREKSNYFARNTTPISPNDLLKLLNKRLDGNPVVDVYVKWQLLSLHKVPFEGENAEKALRLYRSSVAAPVRLGVGNDNEMQLMLRQVNKDNLSQANTVWLSRRTAQDRLAAPFWAYRDELYSRLPKSFEIVRSGFEDADQRLQRGYDARNFIDKLMLDLRGLAAGAKPVEINQMAQLVRFYSGREGALVYDQIQDYQGKIRWKMVRFRFDKKKMEQLAKDLEDTAKLSF